MEGVNMGGFLLGFLAVLTFGGVGLVAVGLWIFRLNRAALLVFATGLLSASLIAALAALSFLQQEYKHDASGAEIMVAVLTLVSAGAGQFIAALRGPRGYLAAFGCAAGSLVYGTIAGMGGADAMPLTLPAGLAVSLALAMASVVVAVLVPPTGRRQPPAAEA